MGFVSTDIIDAFVREQVLDQVADLLDLDVLEAEFHAGRHIRQGMAEPVEVDTLLAEAHDCRTRRTDALTRVGGPGVVPVLGHRRAAPRRPRWDPTTGPCSAAWTAIATSLSSLGSVASRWWRPPRS